MEEKSKLEDFIQNRDQYISEMRNNKFMELGMKFTFLV